MKTQGSSGSQNAFGLGRLWRPDVRDFQHLMKAHLDLTIPLAELPAGKVWTCGAALNQDGLPQCAAYAGECWLHASPIRTMHGPTPQQIYDAAQAIDGWALPHDGTSIRAVWQVLQGEGRVGEYVWIDPRAPDFMEVLARWLLTEGTVILGIPWRAGMFAVKGGYIRVSGDIVGYHGILASGRSGKRHANRLRNSWGSGWGENGSAWISDDDLAGLLREDGSEICAAVEIKVK